MAKKKKSKAVSPLLKTQRKLRAVNQQFKNMEKELIRVQRELSQLTGQ